ncbi:PREDICTED: uncharacterized protein LOC108365044 [Rhagoletis zephyria]|uniref:uncharacterized protein LOC108365044 n=1 Tax=Rhagoletis zephyria TaxID=28612 RepID=UPI0008116D5A|nr:PREDICTED: uncharacterized protein LOC108365044 [Rhagoletis zephyria]XP_017474559.1 PREDICTED: uncharacterized protein LOC108365044 [Rhagoletis zephyria]
MSRKRPLDEKESNKTTCTVVKKALRLSCKNFHVYDQIQKDVEEMSSLFIELSRYIHFTLMKRWEQQNFEPINFLDCYYHLMVKKKPKYTIDQEYNMLRKNLKLYDSSYRPNLFVENANKFLTIFHNNIWMHGCTRLRKYFKFEEDKKKVYNTLSYLFDKNSKNSPDEAVLERMRTDLKWNGKKLHEIENVKLFWSSIELFYNLQRYNEIKEIQNFSLIPQLKHGLHHVRYDRFAFHQLLCRLKLFKGPFSSFDKSEFGKYFKIPSTCTKTFSSLQTDGISISFCMEKQIKIQNETKLVKKRKLKEKETDRTGDIPHYSNRVTKLSSSLL